MDYRGADGGDEGLGGVRVAKVYQAKERGGPDTVDETGEFSFVEPGGEMEGFKVGGRRGEGTKTEGSRNATFHGWTTYGL